MIMEKIFISIKGWLNAYLEFDIKQYLYLDVFQV